MRWHHFYSGVDGGDYKTIALVADATGHIRGFARSGCGDIYGSGSVAALAELDKAINDALRAAGARNGDVACAAFSLAGADWPEDFSFLRAELRQRLKTVRALVLVNRRYWRTTEPALLTVSGCRLCAGLAAPSAFDLKTAKDWHASFWGEDLGAVSIGKRALRSIVRSELGIEALTRLTPRVLDALGLASVEDLLHGVTRRGARAAPILARLTPHVLDLAEDGDAAASHIVQRTGQALGSLAGVAAREAAGTPRSPSSSQAASSVISLRY